MRVWKYKLTYNTRQVLELPIGSKVLSFQSQKEQPVIWVLVEADEPDALCESHTFILLETGQCFSESSLVYIGTAQFYGGDYVLHLFELSGGRA